MIILDENIPAGQREVLEQRRMHAYQIGFNIGRSGMQDEDIIPFLLRQRRPTFFTRDGKRKRGRTSLIRQSLTYDYLNDLVERRDRFKNELVIGSRFSAQYCTRQIERWVQRGLPDMLGGRLKLWL